MGKGKFWSEEDENLLKENYLIKNKDEIMELFPNRTWKAIKSKANTYNLKKIDNYEKIPDEELFKTINNIIHKRCKCCGRYLPLDLKYFPQDKCCKGGYRNICKECKGENFNISTAIDWTDEDVEVLIKEYANKTNKELINKFFPNRKIKHIRDKASTLNLKKSDKILKITREEQMTEDVKKKISEVKIKSGCAKGENNPMHGSHRIGKLNPNWKGGITPFKSQIMRTEEYIKWRKEVFERDNYTCQCCGEMTHDVEAHHLNNFADFEEERFDVDNGLTLCKDCHNPNRKGSFHNLYGTLHNTREQFEEYLKIKKEKLHVKEVI